MTEFTLCEPLICLFKTYINIDQIYIFYEMTQIQDENDMVIIWWKKFRMNINYFNNIKYDNLDNTEL